MTEPQRDHGAIDARLQQLHRSAVPEHVRRHPLGRQRWTSLAGDAHMFAQQRLDAVGAEPPTWVAFIGLVSAVMSWGGELNYSDFQIWCRRGCFCGHRRRLRHHTCCQRSARGMALF